jgi:hypothetical protein
MRHARVASTTLFALAALAAAEQQAVVESPKAAAPREYTTQASRPISLSNGDVKQIGKAVLFVTEDDGMTWRKDQELTVPETATSMPSFTFTAPKDGAFGLWTVATRRDGVSEPEPLAGAAPKLVIVVDRAAPSLARLEPTLGGVADGQATLAVSWQVSEPNAVADPVAIEVSTDQGKTFTTRHTGALEGTTGITVPAIGSAEIQVRVVAHDLAGNVLTSPAKAVALPVAARPANPEAELAAAVAALPAPSELGTPGRIGTAMVTAGENPLASAEPVAAPAATGTATTATTAPAGAAATTAPAASVPATDSDVVANSDVETRYAQAAGSPVAQQRGRQTQTSTDLPADSDRPAGQRATAVDPGVSFLTGGEASAALERARRAELDRDVDSALDQYLRLHRSSVAKAAIEDELSLLRRIGDNATILGIVEQLPPELRTDAARLHAARASLKQGDATASAAWASKVRASASEAREAMLVLGQALKVMGRDSEARRVFDKLAGGNDEVAAQARALR